MRRLKGQMVAGWVVVAVVGMAPQAVGLASAKDSGVVSRRGTVGPKLLSLRFKDADLRDVLTAISVGTGINIVADQTVQGKITLSLKKVTLEQALEAIAAAAQLHLVKSDRTYTVSRTPPAPPLTVEFAQARLTVQASRADLRDVLQLIGAKAGISIVPAQAVTGLVTISLTNVPLEAGFEALVGAQGFAVTKREDGLYLVDRPKPTPPPQQEPAPPAPGPAPAPQPPGPPAPAPPKAGVETPAPQKPTGRAAVNADKAPLTEILKSLSQDSGVDIILLSDMPETRTLRLPEMTVDSALQVLLKGTKYAFVKEENRYFVGDVSKLSSAEAALFLTTKVIPLKYIKAEEASTFVSAAVAKDAIRPLPGQSAVAVTGTSEQIERATRELEQVDQPSPQVMLQAVLLETTESADKQLGIEYVVKNHNITAKGPTGGTFVFSTIQNFGEEFAATLTNMITTGKARILANPRVATINGRQASLMISDERYFRTSGIPSTEIPTQQQQQQQGGENVLFSPFVQSQIQSIKAGITLQITPWVGALGDITVEVEPEVSSITGTGPEGLPELSSRNAKTTIRVKDGQTIVIGGLKQKEKTKSVTKPFLLGDLPIIGGLFRSTHITRRETDLVILITPTLLTEEGKVPSPPAAPEAEGK